MDFLKEYNPHNYKLKNQNFTSFEKLYSSIPKEGSLGLLAMGAVGLKLWRKKRSEIENHHKNSSKTDKE